jgi:ribosomal protein L33
MTNTPQKRIRITGHNVEKYVTRRNTAKATALLKIGKFDLDITKLYVRNESEMEFYIHEDTMDEELAYITENDALQQLAEYIYEAFQKTDGMRPTVEVVIRF